MSLTGISDSSSFVQTTVDGDAGASPENIISAYAAARAGSVQTRESSRGYAIAKRAFDIFVSASLLIVLLPAFVGVAILVKLTSPGPIVFGQQRCGRDGKTFRCYKFRTMVQNAEILRDGLLDRNEMSGPVFKIRNDPRITPLGRVLRKTSIDELPQLWNVLRGDMSFVGPRPPLPAEVATYTTRELVRLSVPPGITCLWQVSGRSDLDFQRWIELDIEYIERRCFWYDMWLLVRTVPAVITGRGAL